MRYEVFNVNVTQFVYLNKVFVWESLSPVIFLFYMYIIEIANLVVKLCAFAALFSRAVNCSCCMSKVINRKTRRKVFNG